MGIQYTSFLNNEYTYLPSILALSEGNIVCYHSELKKNSELKNVLKTRRLKNVRGMRYRGMRKLGNFHLANVFL